MVKDPLAPLRNLREMVGPNRLEELLRKDLDRMQKAFNPRRNYYHSTTKENESLILQQGLRPGYSRCLSKVEEIRLEYLRSGRQMTSGIERALREARERCMESQVVWVTFDDRIAKKNAYAGKEMEVELREALGLPVHPGLAAVVKLIPSGMENVAREDIISNPAILAVFQLTIKEREALRKESPVEPEEPIYGEITLAYLPPEKLARIEDIPSSQLFRLLREGF